MDAQPVAVEDVEDARIGLLQVMHTGLGDVRSHVVEQFVAGGGGQVAGRGADASQVTIDQLVGMRGSHGFFPSCRIPSTAPRKLVHSCLKAVSARRPSVVNS